MPVRFSVHSRLAFGLSYRLLQIQTAELLSQYSHLESFSFLLYNLDMGMNISQNSRVMH